jgi:hypothetical protein
MKKSRLFISIAAGLIAFTVIASNTTPVHRPLIEEYTGTWCGWCVRGLAGMELLSQTFGDDFIGVAYHEGDAMQVVNENQYPNYISGFPSAFVERYYDVDPLYGTGNTTGEIVSFMEQIANLSTIAGIDVTAKWTSPEKTAIDVNVTSYFTVNDNNAKYAIEIMLIADDLYGTGTPWNQNNNYSGYTQYAKDRYLGTWVKKPSVVTGYHFNDVLIGTSGVIAGSLPSNLVAYDDYGYNYTFTLSNLPNPSLVQNKDNLHVIAIVVNTSNKRAINANRCYIDDYAAVIPGDVNNDEAVDIADVTALIDYLLTGNAELVNTANSDVDGDGNILIADVTALIDLILSKLN